MSAPGRHASKRRAKFPALLRLLEVTWDANARGDQDRVAVLLLRLAAALDSRGLLARRHSIRRRRCR